MASIVGTWNTFVDWGNAGTPVKASALTFNADGTWTYAGGGGRWVQVEGMYFFTFNGTAGLVYTANVTRNVVSGIMGYAIASPVVQPGNWWGTKPGAPTLTAAVTDDAETQDLLLGPANPKR